MFCCQMLSRLVSEIFPTLGHPLSSRRPPALRGAALCAALAGALLFAPAAPAAGGLEVETGGSGCPLVTTEGTTLCGRITLAGGGTAQYYFELGTTTDYGQDFPAAPGSEVTISPDGPSDVSASLSGLAPDTTYHYRLVASGGGETLQGDDAVFRTPPAELNQPPEAPVTEPCAGPVSDLEQKLCGRLNPESSARVGYYFALNLGTSCTGGQKVAGPTKMQGEDIEVSVTASGLMPGAQYTYCLVATNDFGETSGQPLTFVQPSLPGSDPPPPVVIVDPLAPVVLPPQSLPVQPVPVAKLAKALKRCQAKPRKQRSRCRKRARRRIERRS
jgi:hypothetical protein